LGYFDGTELALFLLQEEREMTKQDKIKVLAEYREIQELKAAAEKRYKELKKQIEAEIESGKHGDFVVAFEFREVREYIVPARTDKIVKVVKL
jgi:hypothetical protein